MTIEEEISAIELVITEYLNNNFNKNKNLTKNYGFQEKYETPSQATIEVKISSNDNCFNVNSLFYKNSNNGLDINNVELFQMDLLDISLLEKKFDIIECGGVLHHMENPINGFRSLLKVAKKDTFINLKFILTNSIYKVIICSV